MKSGDVRSMYNPVHIVECLNMHMTASVFFFLYWIWNLCNLIVGSTLNSTEVDFNCKHGKVFGTYKDNSQGK